MQMFPLLKALFVLCALAHLIACVFHFVSLPDFWLNEKEAQRGRQGDTWLTREFGQEPENEPVGPRYVASLYYAITTMSTVGYGDISATNLIERIFAMVAMVVGVAYFTFLIGNVNVLMARLQKRQDTSNQRLQAVREFCVDAKLPKHIRKPMIGFYRRQRTCAYDSRQLLNDLPSDLRKRVLQHLYGDLIAQVALFQNTPDSFVSEICNRIRLAYYQAGSIVMQKGEIGREMYIVAAGALEIVELRATDTPVVFSAGEYFGEGAVVGVSAAEAVPRTATVVASTHCTLCVLTSGDVAEVFKAYPTQKDQLTRFYKARRAQTNRTLERQRRSSCMPPLEAAPSIPSLERSPSRSLHGDIAPQLQFGEESGFHSSRKSTPQTDTILQNLAAACDRNADRLDVLEESVSAILQLIREVRANQEVAQPTASPRFLASSRYTRPSEGDL